MDYQVNSKGYYGIFGGAYIPEMMYPNIDHLQKHYLEIIERLKKEEGCDGVALVCTEIPLLVTADVSPLPSLDSTRLLARAAFEVCVGKRPFPVWRGGPVDGR
jgi:aspartate racemase